MADDDLFGFFNELKEVKPPVEGEAGGGGGKEEGQQHIGPVSPPGTTGKRARGKRGSTEKDAGQCCVSLFVYGKEESNHHPIIIVIPSHPSLPRPPPNTPSQQDEDDAEADTHEIGPAMPPAYHPVFKKAKAVAAAKPLLYEPPSIGPAEPPPSHYQQQQVFAPPRPCLPTRTNSRHPPPLLPTLPPPLLPTNPTWHPIPEQQQQQHLLPR